MGSFLLRPHETLPCQYFLSFRTGHRGQSLTGRDAVVKHAIIRRSDGSLQTSSSTATTATTAATIGSNTNSGSAATSTAAVSSSNTNNYSNTTSAAPHPLTIATPNTPTKPITAAEVAAVATDGNASPLPAALRTPVPTRSALSVHTHSEEGLNTDVLPQLRESRYIYHCGKLGPCYSLHDILR